MDNKSKESKFCCNPFSAHSRKRTNLFPVSESLCQWYSDTIKKDDFVCRACKARCYREKGTSARKIDQHVAQEFLPDLYENGHVNAREVMDVNCQQEVNQQLCHDGATDNGQNNDDEPVQEELFLQEWDETECEIQTSFHEADETFEEDPILKRKRVLSAVNVLLKEFDISPIDSLDDSVPGRVEEKVSIMAEHLKCFFKENYQGDNAADDLEEIITPLKDKFHELQKYADKLQLLTILPINWTDTQVANAMECSTYLAHEARLLRLKSGILSRPDTATSHSHRLSDETLHLVKSFYCRDDISRMMPGKRDFVTVLEGGLKLQIQKRLILGNLREIYSSFKEQHPTVKIGFSKFAELRPDNCIMVGAKGTHTVCVCQIHQNVELMVAGAKLKKISDSTLNCPTTPREMLKQMMCNPPTTDCHFGNCVQCPGYNNIEIILRQVFVSKGVQEIIFNEWTNTDRSQLQQISYTAEEYIETLKERLLCLREHDFITRSQNSFLEQAKINLVDNAKEFIVLLDFSENYASVIQDEVQAHHWNKQQTTIHPYVIYRKEKGNIEHDSLVVISDCLDHAANTVYFFQKKLIDYMKNKYGSEIRKILYFSDGAPAQYKNRSNLINLAYHFNDFGIIAEWHFFATSHGKSPCDGVGGTLKRLATRTSLQRPKGDQIITPQDLYNWAVSINSKMDFVFCSAEDIREQYTSVMEKRFREAKTIAGTRKIHAFIPLFNELKLKIKTFSLSETTQIRSVTCK